MSSCPLSECEIEFWKVMVLTVNTIIMVIFLGFYIKFGYARARITDLDGSVAELRTLISEMKTINADLRSQGT